MQALSITRCLYIGYAAPIWVPPPDAVLCRESPLYFGALGSVGPTPIHPELGSEKAERI